MSGKFGHLRFCCVHNRQTPVDLTLLNLSNNLCRRYYICTARRICIADTFPSDYHVWNSASSPSFYIRDRRKSRPKFGLLIVLVAASTFKFLIGDSKFLGPALTRELLFQVYTKVFQHGRSCNVNYNFTTKRTFVTYSAGTVRESRFVRLAEK